jgi:AAA15 family ATPase/GTPase
MIDNLKIENYRAFREVEFKGLKRVNLFVGKNNSGKTCLLEALDLLGTLSPNSFWLSAQRRNENISIEAAPNNWQTFPDPHYTFHGRDIGANNSIIITSSAQKIITQLKISISNSTPQPIPQVQPSSVQPQVLNNLIQQLDFEVNGIKVSFPMMRGGLQFFQLTPFQSQILPPCLITTNATNSMGATQAWAPIAATDAEEKIIEALKVIEPDIEKIAASAFPVPTLFVRLKGVKERVPIGNLGDGTIKLLMLAGHLSGLEANGILLIDEIDDGLHVSAMQKLWEIVLNITKDRNIQIFATTHSDDCLRGLAAALKIRNSEESVALYRITKNEGHIVTRYDWNEIIRSAEAGIEVRG